MDKKWYTCMSTAGLYTNIQLGNFFLQTTARDHAIENTSRCLGNPDKLTIVQNMTIVLYGIWEGICRANTKTV